MTTIRVFLFVFFSASFLQPVFSAHADKGSHQQKAEQLLLLTGVPKQLDSTVSAIMYIYLESEPQLKKYHDIIQTYTKTYVAWNQLKPDIINLYTKMYTEDELTELIRFYSTPLGKKTLETIPSLLKQSALIVKESFEKNGHKLDQMIAEREQDLQEEAERLFR